VVWRVVRSVDSRLEVRAQVVWRRAGRRLVDGRHVGVCIVRVDALSAGIAILAGRDGRRGCGEVAAIEAVNIGRTVGEHVGCRDQGDRRGDLSADNGLSIAVTGSATHRKGDVRLGLLAAGGKGTYERHGCSFDVA